MVENIECDKWKEFMVHSSMLITLYCILEPHVVAGHDL